MLVDHFTGINFTELSKAGAEAIAADKEPLFSKSFDPNLPLKECIKIVQEQLLLLRIDWKGVVLIIDELDRCLPEYAIKVLERLHHICYCTETDAYSFIQLMAINKEELACSILKVFNRQSLNKWNPFISFSTQKDKNNNIQGDLSGTIENEDYQRKKDEFSNYYLQKFIQMIIPVPEDEKDLPMVPILNGFENEFDVQKSIVPLSHVEKFFNMVMIDFPIRIKEELVEKVKIIHQLTVEINSVKNKPSYGVLCVELMDVLFDGVLKRHVPFYEYSEDRFWFELKDSSNVLCIKEYNRFSSALKMWSFSKMKEQSGNFYFKLDSPENYIKGFYVKGAFLCKGRYRQSEENFVKMFREMKERFM